MMTLSLTAAQIAIFNTRLGTLVQSASNLVSELGMWNAQIIDRSLVSGPTAGYFTAQVTDAQKFWTDLTSALDRYLGIIAASGSVTAA
jgi:hypothetical protein